MILAFHPTATRDGPVLDCIQSSTTCPIQRPDATVGQVQLTRRAAISALLPVAMRAVPRYTLQAKPRSSTAPSKCMNPCAFGGSGIYRVTHQANR